MAILSNGELQLNLMQEISGYQKPFVGKYLRHDCKTEKKKISYQTSDLLQMSLLSSKGKK